jgi:hypothetical protein
MGWIFDTAQRTDTGPSTLPCNIDDVQGYCIVYRNIALCKIDIHVHVFVISFQIFLFHQHLYPPFDAADLQYEVVLDSLNGSQFEVLIKQLFACLHNAHDGSIQIILLIPFDRVLRSTRLFGLQNHFRQFDTGEDLKRADRFLDLNGVDVNF